MINAQLSAWFPTKNIIIPKEGPKTIRADLDFSTESSISIEGLLATTTGTISYIQGMYVDNTDNDNILNIVCQVTQQEINVPANSQGYFNVLITNPPRFIASTTPAANLEVAIFFYNVPMPSTIWGPGGTLVAGNWLTDVQLRASPVPVTHPIGGAYTNRSIANLSGASETLMAANANRRILIVSNEGATAIAVNLTGGTAALNTAGNVTLASGGSITLDNYPPTSAITIIGTANADVTAYEG